MAVSGCEKNNEDLNADSTKSSNEQTVSEENYVDLSEALNVGKNLYFLQINDNLANKGERNTKKTIKNSTEIKNNNGKVSFYVINYNEGGFVLLSADKRTRPILGYSDENEFIVDEESYPLGLQFWMNDTKDQIAEIQKSDQTQSKDENLAWEKVVAELPREITGKEPPMVCTESTTVVTVGPLLNSTWNQTGAFNDQLPFITCGGAQFQVFAGCVPIAMGQIMRFHQFPATYNWGNIPAGFGTNTTALFIRDIHHEIRSLNSGNPSYSCTATGVSASANMGTVLKSRFGYSSATFSDYNYTTVKANIANNRPVILQGSNSSAGHMWVCDGSRTTTYKRADCTGISYLSFHMNWGWGGTNNGWFGFDNFNPAGTNYNSNKKMVHGIVP